MSRGTCPKNILLPVHLPDLEALERLFSETFGKELNFSSTEGKKFRLVSGQYQRAGGDSAGNQQGRESIKTLE